MNDVMPERKRSWGSDEHQGSDGENSGCLTVVKRAISLLMLFILGIGLLVLITYFRGGFEEEDLALDPQEYVTTVDHPAEGQYLPNLELLPLVNTDENYMTNSEETVRLINIWAVHCPPCVAETPYLAEVYEEFKSEPGFQFLSVCMTDAFSEDQPSTPTDILEFLSRAGAENLPVYGDPRSSVFNAIVQFGLDEVERLAPEHAALGIPITILVDPDHVIVEMWIGFDPADGDLIAEEMTRRIREELMK